MNTNSINVGGKELFILRNRSDGIIFSGAR